MWIHMPPQAPSRESKEGSGGGGSGDGGDGECVVAAEQGQMLVLAFHPELTSDTRWHGYFVKNVLKSLH
jgi:hypothetical protein